MLRAIFRDRRFAPILIRHEERMKAVVFESVMNCKVCEVPTPDISEGGILLRVLACGLCGSDLRTIRSGHKNVTPPWILGHEICGQVEHVSEPFQNMYSVGDRLAVGPVVYDPMDPFCIDGKHELSANVREIGQQWNGGLAEYILVPEAAVECGNVLPVPESLESHHAALVEPASSVIHAHEKAHTGLGDSVLILGAGPIGCLHVDVARACGASNVIVSDINDARLSLVEAFEPDMIVNARSENLEDVIATTTNGRGIDVVITANPSPDSQIQAVRLAAKGGRVVLFGGLPHDQSTPGIDTNIVHYQNLSLIGVSRFAPRHFRTSLQLISSGQIRANKIISQRLPLERFQVGLDKALAGAVLKIVFEPNT